MKIHEFTDVIVELIKNNSNIECKGDDGLITGIEDIDVGRCVNGDIIIIRFENGEVHTVYVH